jgi:hypothetical protein
MTPPCWLQSENPLFSITPLLSTWLHALFFIQTLTWNYVVSMPFGAHYHTPHAPKIIEKRQMEFCLVHGVFSFSFSFSSFKFLAYQAFRGLKNRS